MMERLLRPADIAVRYDCTIQTARKYIRQMEHMENPLTVSEKALREWENRRLSLPPEEIKVPRRRANK